MCRQRCHVARLNMLEHLTFTFSNAINHCFPKFCIMLTTFLARFDFVKLMFSGDV